MKFMYEPAEVKEVDLHHLVTVSADQGVQEMPPWVSCADAPIVGNLSWLGISEETACGRDYLRYPPATAENTVANGSFEFFDPTRLNRLTP